MTKFGLNQNSYPEGTAELNKLPQHRYVYAATIPYRWGNGPYDIAVLSRYTLDRLYNKRRVPAVVYHAYLGKPVQIWEITRSDWRYNRLVFPKKRG